MVKDDRQIKKEYVDKLHAEAAKNIMVVEASKKVLDPRTAGVTDRILNANKPKPKPEPVKTVTKKKVAKKTVKKVTKKKASKKVAK